MCVTPVRIPTMHQLQAPSGIGIVTKKMCRHPLGRRFEAVEYLHSQTVYVEPKCCVEVVYANHRAQESRLVVTGAPHRQFGFKFCRKDRAVHLFARRALVGRPEAKVSAMTRT